MHSRLILPWHTSYAGAKVGVAVGCMLGASVGDADGASDGEWLGALACTGTDIDLADAQRVRIRMFFALGDVTHHDIHEMRRKPFQPFDFGGGEGEVGGWG